MTEIGAKYGPTIHLVAWHANFPLLLHVHVSKEERVGPHPASKPQSFLAALILDIFHYVQYHGLCKIMQSNVRKAFKMLTEAFLCSAVNSASYSTEMSARLGPFSNIK